MKDEWLMKRRFNEGLEWLDDNDIRLVQKRDEFWWLWQRLSKLKPKSILLLGAAFGGSLYMLSKLRPQYLVCIDVVGGVGGDVKCKPALDYVLNEIRKTPIKFIHIAKDTQIVNTKVELVYQMEAVQKCKAWVDFLYIDADHSEGATESDYVMYSPLVVRGGIIGIHDISPGCAEWIKVAPAWNRLKAGKKFEECMTPSDIGGTGIIYNEL